MRFVNRKVLAAALVVAATSLLAVGSALIAPATAAGPDTTYLVLAPAGRLDCEGRSEGRRGGRHRGRRATPRSASWSPVRPTPISRPRRPAPASRPLPRPTASARCSRRTRHSGRSNRDVQQATGDPTGEPLFGLQWNMTQIDVPEAHAVTTGSPDVVVGVLDSGISSTHPDLATQIAKDKSASCLGGVVEHGRGRLEPDDVRPRHARRGHDRRRAQRRRRRRRRPGREGRLGEGRHRRRLHLSRGRGVRLRLGRRARDADHEQQLLHRPVGVQLPQRPAPAAGLAGRAACDPVLAEQGRAQHRVGGQLERRPAAQVHRRAAARTTAARRSRRARSTAPASTCRPRRRASSPSPRSARSG